MNITDVRKIYSTLPENVKNIKWRKLTDKELDRLQQSRQVLSNCYDMSVRHALLASDEGREFLRNRVRIPSNTKKYHGCKVTFNINGVNKTYKSGNVPKIRLGGLMTLAVNKMIKDNPGQKPLISRFGRFGLALPCEFNRPSNAFKWYTGKEPISFGEGILPFSLKGDKKEVLDIVHKMGEKEPKDYSFIVMSSSKPLRINGHKKWHCLTVSGVDNEKETMNIINKRTNKTIKITFDELVNKFKGFVGMFHN